MDNVFKKISDWLRRKNEPHQINVHVNVTGTLKLHWADVLQISQDSARLQNPGSRDQGLPGPATNEKSSEPTFEIPANIQLPSVKFGKDTE